MASSIRIEIDAVKLKELVVDYLRKQIGNDVTEDLSINDVAIETRSKQNYRSEWESADFRAVVARKI